MKTAEKIYNDVIQNAAYNVALLKKGKEIALSQIEDGFTHWHVIESCLSDLDCVWHPVYEVAEASEKEVVMSDRLRAEEMLVSYLMNIAKSEYLIMNK